MLIVASVFNSDAKLIERRVPQKNQQWYNVSCLLGCQPQRLNVMDSCADGGPTPSQHIGKRHHPGKWFTGLIV